MTLPTVDGIQPEVSMNSYFIYVFGSFLFNMTSSEYDIV
jgi:hypothetical protein